MPISLASNSFENTSKLNCIVIATNNSAKPILASNVTTVTSGLIAISALSLGLKSENVLLSSIELAIVSFVVMFLVYKISKILKKAKRDYYVVVGEYMFLEFILLLILALTFNTVRELDYSIFTSFLILTPTYKVLYMIVIIVFILVLGVLYNDKQLKKLKRK